MSTRALRPWTDLMKLHPDVEGRALTDAVFAIDLGGAVRMAPGSEAEIIRPDRDASRGRRDHVRSFIGVVVTVTRIEAFLETLA